MESIINFFQWISNLFEILFNFIVNFIDSILNFLKILPTVLTFLFSSISYLPDVLISFATIGITISIVLLLIGRQNQT